MADGVFDALKPAVPSFESPSRPTLTPSKRLEQPAGVAPGALVVVPETFSPVLLDQDRDPFTRTPAAPATPEPASLEPKSAEIEPFGAPLPESSASALAPPPAIEPGSAPVPMADLATAGGESCGSSL